MFCKSCGVPIDKKSKYCSSCGTEIHTGFVPPVIQLVCKSCGASMDYDDERPVLFCPFCGSKELLIENDSITIERIRTKAYKDIELEKLYYEEKSAQRKADEKKSKRFNTWVLVGAIFCFVMFIGGVNNSGRYVPSSIVVLIQALLLVGALLINKGIIKTERQNLHILLATAAGLLAILFILLMP